MLPAPSLFARLMVVDQRTYRMELQYDGTGLHGWAKQGRLATVEGSLEEALAKVLGRSPRLSVAGRTDAGVHAWRQVVSLSLPSDTDDRRLLRSLNALTPAGIVVTGLVPVGDGFDARRDVVSRSYRYFIQLGGVDSPFYVRYLWRSEALLDVSLLHETAALVTGRHDFTAFTPSETEHRFFRRQIWVCRWRRWGSDRLFLQIEADAFLRHMVRTLVGTMAEVAAGERTLEDFRRLLEGAPRSQAGLSAPSRGLFLWDIRYPEDDS